MRTTIMLDQSVIALLMRETGLKSKAKAVRLAVDDYLRRQRLKRVLSRCGSYKFDRATADWRHLER